MIVAINVKTSKKLFKYLTTNYLNNEFHVFYLHFLPILLFYDAF
jgi:hypothetical protein